MVLKTWAANCLTLEGDYPRLLLERDEWRQKYEAAQAQVLRLFEDRDKLSLENAALAKDRLELVVEFDKWRREQKEKWTTLEVVGVGAVGVLSGALIGGVVLLL